MATLLALGFGLAPVTRPGPTPGGSLTPASAVANHQPTVEGEQLPVISIHSTGNIARGKTGSFVLEMKPAAMFSAAYVNFKVSGSAFCGVDYAPLISPANIGQSGYATILVHAFADPRASSKHQAYSVAVTLEAGSGYALSEQKSAVIWIKSL